MGSNSWFGPRFLNHQVAYELWFCFSLYCIREVWSLAFLTDYKKLNLTRGCENQDGCKYVCD